MFKSRYGKNPFSVYFIILLFILHITHPDIINGQSIPKNSGVSCSDKIESAETAYFSGKFDTSMRLIKECLKNKELNKANRIKAYTILANISLIKKNRNTAKEIVNKIFELSPTYSPTTKQYKPNYVTLVKEVKAERTIQKLPKKKSTSKTWLWVGLGAAALTTGAILLLSNGDDQKPVEEKSLIEPPEFP